MPVELKDPETGGPLQFYAGDPATVRLRLVGVDRTTSTFVAQIRRRAGDDETIGAWHVTSTLDGEDTLVELTLAGDTAAAIDDGETRLGVRSFEFDAQEYDSTGKAAPTLARAKAQLVTDVTR